MTHGKIVAKALSRQGGVCAASSSHHIPKLGVIYKVQTPGSTTTQGNGPGIWVCKVCAEFCDDPRDLWEE